MDETTTLSFGVGDRIRKARRNAGLTADQLAARLGVSKRTLLRWEAENVTPRVAFLRAIADETGADVEWLAA